jgi:hypothetical protein
VDRPARLSLKICDPRGRLVRTLAVERVVEDGAVRWDGTDGRGRQVAPGVYFYEVSLNGQVRVGKLTLIQ